MNLRETPCKQENKMVSIVLCAYEISSEPLQNLISDNQPLTHHQISKSMCPKDLIFDMNIHFTTQIPTKTAFYDHQWLKGKTGTNLLTLTKRCLTVVVLDKVVCKPKFKYSSGQ